MGSESCIVSAVGAQRLRDGRVWVYRQDVVQAPSAPSGAIVPILDPRGTLLGRGFWAEHSPVAVRLLVSGARPADETLLSARIEAALERRRQLFPEADGFRVIHGEADLLPGVLVDKYGDGLGVQLLSEGAEAHRDVILRTLDRLLSPRTIALRHDTSARTFEQLPRETSLWKGSDPVCQYHEGANLFEIDLLQERKTGAFLDQRENHLRAGEYARGEALDAFCYHGGFALSMARRATSVLAIDEDPNCARRAGENAARNGLSHVEARAENAFDALHGFDRSGRRFDTIVLDPPAFAKRKDGLESAVRAYRELNLRALKILRPEGMLVTCSCSAKVSMELMESIVQAAARDARRSVQVLERRGAGRDHPVLVGIPETEYLTCLFLRVLPD